MINGIGEKTKEAVKQQISDAIDTHFPKMQRVFEDELKVSMGINIKRAGEKLMVETSIAYVVEKISDKQTGFINENQPVLFPVTNEKLVINEQRISNDPT